MKNKLRVMIRLHVIKYSESLKSFLLNKLEKILTDQYQNQLKVNFESKETYWKIPEQEECFFGIYFKNDITVKELVKIFNVEWDYRCVPCYNVDDPLHKTIDCEDAIWAKNDGEVFLHENVVWVHIYT